MILEKKTKVARGKATLFLVFGFVVLVLTGMLTGCGGKQEYTVTQYADIEGYQCMSYTIEDGEGGLIIVDGGRAWQTTSMVDIINEKGGRVDAWIITHPHDDHCGVLASVLAAEEPIEIGDIYTIDMDMEAYEKQGKRVDQYSYLLMGLEGREDVHLLNTGDELNLLGLQMKVFSAYDETFPSFSHDLGNDGSLVFKLSAQKESFLFCGDTGACIEERMQVEDGVFTDLDVEVGEILADRMIEAYGEELQADYMQVSHHGNNHLPQRFYQAVSPKTAVFDAPEWLMENRRMDTGEPYYYTNPKIVAWLEEMGTEIVSYETVPNVFYLK